MKQERLDVQRFYIDESKYIETWYDEKSQRREYWGGCLEYGYKNYIAGEFRLLEPVPGREIDEKRLKKTLTQEEFAEWLDDEVIQCSISNAEVFIV